MQDNLCPHEIGSTVMPAASSSAAGETRDSSPAIDGALKGPFTALPGAHPTSGSASRFVLASVGRGTVCLGEAG
jgi:hypothetical protein